MRLRATQGLRASVQPVNVTVPILRVERWWSRRGRSRAVEPRVLLQSSRLEPHAHEDGHGLGDAAVPRDPPAHRPGLDAELPSGRHLGQPQALEGLPKLLGGQRHGAFECRAIGPALQGRAIGPTFLLYL